MSVTIRVAGLAELQRKLLALPDKVNRKVLNEAVSDGAALVRDEMRALAPEYTGSVAQGHPPPGTLKRAVFMKHVPTPLGKSIFIVGVRHGKGVKDAINAYYFHFVEFGTVKMSARPFMRPGFDHKKMAALDAIKQSLADGITAAAASL